MTRKGRPFPLVGVGLLALLAIALGFALWVYFTMIRYERVARLHVPADATLAVHVDLEKVALYEPFRKHLLPLVDELETSKTAGPRLSRIRQHTGIDLALDIRELAVAHGPRAGDWVLIAGGKFPRRDVVSGLGEVLRADGIAATLSADQQTLTLASGVAIAQASDGVIVAGSSGARLALALERSDGWERLGLVADTPISFGVLGPALPELGSQPAALAIPALRDLAKIERARGHLLLGEPLTGQAQVEFGEAGDSERAAERVRAVIGALTMLVRLTGSDFFGESRILESAEATAGPDAVQVRFAWQREDVDRAAASLARAARVWAARDQALSPR